MSYQSGDLLTLAAGASALTRGRFVRLVAGLVVPATAGTQEDVVGVTAEDVAATTDVAGVYMVNGSNVVEVEAGAAIALGAQVAAGAAGVAATATSGDIVQGIALSAAGAAGEFVTVLLTKLGAAT